MKKTLFFMLLAAAVAACGGNNASSETTPTPEQQEAEQKLLKKAQSYFAALPEAASFEEPKAQLGKKLYYETALSINGKMSCNSCHDLANFGVDNEPTSPGHAGVRGDRNSPTSYNAWFHVAQFWDGRAADLKEQAKGPILNPGEMGIPDEATAVANIKAIAEYIDMFKKAYPEQEDPITYDNIADAIGFFESTLRTPSAFDKYVNGDLTALTEEQKAGMETFINTGCITCHTGPGFGGHMYQKFGLVEGPYWDYTKSEKQDLGRFAVTGKEYDKAMFKVPALRNVTKTYPYFHDGSVADLAQAVKIMGKTQLGKDLTDEETKQIVAFLDALTGEIPSHALNNETQQASF